MPVEAGIEMAAGIASATADLGMYQPPSIGAVKGDAGAATPTEPA